ncbi:MAG: TIR domain-containing protein [Anaerolineae bacterium]|nr:TIR domain-containing protein [Anaerolineae bacterium]
MNRLFISYQRSNQAFAERLARDLGDAGLEVWIDLRQIQAGELWEKEIYRGLERAEFLVACLSRRMLQSEWCQRELLATRSAGKPIYPVMVEECFAELQAHAALSWLTDVQFIRFEGRYEKALPELLEALPGGRKLGAFDVYDPAKLVNPFKGLEAFQQRDAAYFFGREDLTQRALQRLRRTRFLAVVGASGSGKSSLVRAGIIPQLRAGAIPGADQFPVVIFTPGSAPLEALAQRIAPLLAQHDAAHTPASILAALRSDGGIVNVIRIALTGLPESARLVLVVDQFEEIFTRAGRTEREPFLETLLSATGLEASRATVIVTMRADFFNQLSAHPALAALFEGDHLLIATEMTTANLLRAIEGPAAAVGLKFEAGLVDKILEDVKNQPGSLPLLQYALKELYERRDGAKLTLAAYEAIGGVRQALARHAEDIYSQFDETTQGILRRVLLRLVEVSETGEATRRRVPQSEMTLRGVAPADIQTIVDRLTAPEARLLIASRSVNAGGEQPITWLEVSHEALIREWERFKAWVAASVEDLRYESELRKAAADWENSRRDSAYLLTGKRLNRAEIWQEDNEVTPLQRDLIEASLSARAAGALAEQNRLTRQLRLQRYAIWASVLLFVAALIGVIFVQSTNNELARREQLISDTNDSLEQQIEIAQRNETAARSLAVAGSAIQAQNDSNPDLALALVVAASSGTEVPPQAERTLADIAFDTGTRLRLPVDGRVTALDVSADGQRLAVGFQNGGVRLLEARTGSEVQRFDGHVGGVTDVALSPDGTQLLSASGDASDNFILWDVASGAAVRRWETYNNQRVNAVAFAGAERLPANVTDDLTQLAVSRDGQVSIVGTRDGRLQRVAGSAILWDIAPLAAARSVPRVTALALNDSGRLILAGFSDGSMLLLNSQDGSLVQQFVALDNGVVGLAFISGTTQFIAAGTDNALRVWDSLTGRQLETFEIDASITAIAISPDGHSAYTGTVNNTLRIWDIQGSQEQVRLTETTISGVALSPDARLAAVVGGSAREGSSGGVVNIWQLATGTLLHSLRLDSDSSLFSSVAFSPEGTWLAAGTNSGTLALWQVRDFTLTAALPGAHSGFIRALAFSPDGLWLASGASDSSIQLWATATGTRVRTLTGHRSGISGLAFSRDASRVLSGSTDTTLILWDAASGASLQQFDGHNGPVQAVALNDDGTQALSGGGFPDNTVRVWETATGRELRRFGGHDQGINGVAFVPGSHDIVSGSADGTVRVWDVDSSIELRRVAITSERGRAIRIKTLALAADGNTILLGVNDTPDNTLRLIQIIPQTPDLLAWVAQNRFVRPLNCNERLLFGLADGRGQVFVQTEAGGFLPLRDDTGRVLASLPQRTSLQLLQAALPGVAQVRVCTPDGVEGLVDSAGLTGSP